MAEHHASHPRSIIMSATSIAAFAVRWVVVYVRFFWSIAWRSVVIAMGTAVLSGVGLGVVASAQGWTEPQMTTAASLIGTPITVLAVLGVVALRIMTLRRQTLA